jgi:hypothetical protein
MDLFLNDWWFEFFSYMAATWLALLVWNRVYEYIRVWWIIEKQAILKPYELENGDLVFDKRKLYEDQAKQEEEPKPWRRRP